MSPLLVLEVIFREGGYRFRLFFLRISEYMRWMLTHIDELFRALKPQLMTKLLPHLLQMDLLLILRNSPLNTLRPDRLILILLPPIIRLLHIPQPLRPQESLPPITHRNFRFLLIYIYHTVHPFF